MEYKGSFLATTRGMCEKLQKSLLSFCSNLLCVAISSDLISVIIDTGIATVVIMITASNVNRLAIRCYSLTTYLIM
ncbi:hypothetical protein Y032_0022g649 [Ancylostoma ceylanicum]|uniref:Uncharacterized protein n=1 Tax=Ancylostoma ceylanicum TaxID=53326 RepID=A0A016UZ82_9BILA|nr:hypothetical protein Y032_0022g649 [Ancylostoma ceylanicum]